MASEIHSPESNSSTAESLGAMSTQFFAPSEHVPISHGISARPEVAGPSHLFRYRVLKRAVDILIVLASAPLLLLLVGLVAATVRLSSPGPIFFSHRRIRRHGAFFSMWKFRTMCVNSSEVLESYLSANPGARAEWRKTHKLKSDPRVNRVGLFLRRTSLDELPQLWNVLTGSMSLVGPRPIVAAEVEKYGDHFADYCMVKPGITGLWQVSGRSALSYAERVQLDHKYAHHWSFFGDLKILVKTLSSVVNQDGAY
jgi:lipopolysaccharide/colanic/teichoic acid biosynthesis glycosyltransferase